MGIDYKASLFYYLTYFYYYLYVSLYFLVLFMNPTILRFSYIHNNHRLINRLINKFELTNEDDLGQINSQVAIHILSTIKTSNKITSFPFLLVRFRFKIGRAHV